MITMMPITQILLLIFALAALLFGAFIYIKYIKQHTIEHKKIIFPLTTGLIIILAAFAITALIYLGKFTYYYGGWASLLMAIVILILLPSLIAVYKEIPFKLQTLFPTAVIREKMVKPAPVKHIPAKKIPQAPLKKVTPKVIKSTTPAPVEKQKAASLEKEPAAKVEAPAQEKISTEKEASPEIIEKVKVALRSKEEKTDESAPTENVISENLTPENPTQKTVPKKTTKGTKPIHKTRPKSKGKRRR